MWKSSIAKSHHHWSENRIICPSAYMQLRLHVRACCHSSFVLGVVHSSARGGNTHGVARRSGEILHLTDLFYSTLYQRSSRNPRGSAAKSSFTFCVLRGANGWWCSSAMMRCFYSIIPNSISHDFLPFRSVHTSASIARQRTCARVCVCVCVYLRANVCGRNAGNKL